MLKVGTPHLSATLRKLPVLLLCLVLLSALWFLPVLSQLLLGTGDALSLEFGEQMLNESRKWYSSETQLIGKWKQADHKFKGQHGQHSDTPTSRVSKCKKSSVVEVFLASVSANQDRIPSTGDAPCWRVRWCPPYKVVTVGTSTVASLLLFIFPSLAFLGVLLHPQPVV